MIFVFFSFWFCFVLFLFLFFCKDVHIQNLIDANFVNSFLPTNERGVVNDYAHNTNVVFTQQKSIVIVISDLGLERPNVDFVHVFQNKMMVQAPKPNKKHVDVDENF
jgi:hypothetical protein